VFEKEACFGVRVSKDMDMRRINPLIAAVLLALPARSFAEPPTLEREVDALFSSSIQPDDAGAAVLVAQHGRILFEKAYGLADREHNLLVTTETKFRICSVTKQFTAAAILKLQEQGKLSVNDKLSIYMPDFPGGNKVTLHQLLTHTSGIANYAEKPGFFFQATNTITPDALIQSFKNDPYDFQPGTAWRYSNSGYVLLAWIVEKVSGQSYETFLLENFFKPLKMLNTGVYRPKLQLTNEALGYSYENGRFVRAIDWDMSRFFGAGVLYSTVEDLYRWNEGVFGGQVLNEMSLKQALTPARTKQNQDEDVQDGYGYGWFIDALRGGLQEVSHGGDIPGFRSVLVRLPKEDFSVVILMNSAPGRKDIRPRPWSRQLVKLYMGGKLPPPPVRMPNPNVLPEAFDVLAGRYDRGDCVVNVGREGAHLLIQDSSSAKVEIFPLSETEFFWKDAEQQIRFVKDKTGKVAKAVVHYGDAGRTLYLPRLKDLVPARVDPACYDGLQGQYDYRFIPSEGPVRMTLKVTREGYRLFAQLTDQPKFELLPKSETEFFWKDFDAQITFVKNGQGKVIEAVHQSSLGTFNAPKVE
jgi:CubicO group peptidase (beta-lactamase class C family)